MHRFGSPHWSGDTTAASAAPCSAGAAPATRRPCVGCARCAPCASASAATTTYIPGSTNRHAVCYTTYIHVASELYAQISFYS